MVFKNKHFFSSKKSDSSSPDESNSPRSLGSNSPSRSDKKKPKSTSKDDVVRIPTSTSTTPSFFASACRQTQVNDGLKKKELKGKETLPAQTNTTMAATTMTSSPIKPDSSDSGSCSKMNKGLDTKEVPSSVSPILASSLGLNHIKTRSVPLPQESFFSFKGDKGSGVSNLSRPGGGFHDGNSSSGKSWSSGGKKKDLLSKMGLPLQSNTKWME